MKHAELTTLEAFFQGFPRLYYKKREIILRPYEVPQGISYIKKGYIRYYSVSKNGHELTLLIFKPGDFFPVRWGITGQEVHYYYETLTPVDLYRAPKVKFTQFLIDNPELVFKITEIILLRLRTCYARMEYLVFGAASAKLASILLMLVDEFGRETKAGILIAVPLTHGDIATLIGLTRETVSIEIEKFQRQNILERKGKLFIVKHQKKLQTLSEITLSPM